MEYGVILVKDTRSTEDKNRSDFALVIRQLDVILAELDKNEYLTKDDTIAIARTVAYISKLIVILNRKQALGLTDDEYLVELLAKTYLLITNKLFRDELSKLAERNDICASCSECMAMLDRLYLDIEKADRYNRLAKYRENKNYKGNNNDYKN